MAAAAEREFAALLPTGCTIRGRVTSQVEGCGEDLDSYGDVGGGCGGDDAVWGEGLFLGGPVGVERGVVSGADGVGDFSLQGSREGGALWGSVLDDAFVFLKDG